MEPFDQSGSVESSKIKACRACYRPISISSKYCPACGAFQYPTLELERRVSHAEQSWPAIRNTIIFFLVYLGSVVPVLWLPADQIADGLLVVSVVDAVIILIYWYVSKIPFGEIISVSGSTLRYSGIALVLLVPLLAVNFGYHYLLETSFGTGPILITDSYVTGGYSFWVIIFDICVMPAVWEEIAFRGLIQSQLAKAVRTREAIILSAVLFAIIHCSALSGIYLFGLGLVLGVLRLRSGSLVPCMLLHFFHNLAVVFAEKYEFLTG